MATSTYPNKTTTMDLGRAGGSVTAFDIVRATFAPLASLKLTVALLGLGVFEVLIGTLAQDKLDMWEVMNEYFRAWFTWVELRMFFPDAWFPPGESWWRPAFVDGYMFGGSTRAGFPFPGGLLIGTLMAVNLFSAHGIRFKTQAGGARLWGGVAIIAVGILTTTAIIVTGHNHDGLQGEPSFAWTTLWLWVKLGTIATCLGCGTWLVSLFMSEQKQFAKKVIASVLCAIFAIFSFVVLFGGESVYLGDSGMRILWQLIQGGFAGIVLLVGCIMVFKKRGGIVLIHAGIALMMLYELFVGSYAVEEQMRIQEGKTTNVVSDIREVELAIIDRSDPNEDKVATVPISVMGRETRFLDPDLRIEHEDLPFDIKIVEYYKNTKLSPRRLKKTEKSLANAGIGRIYTLEQRRAISGADGDDNNYATVFATIYPKGKSKDVGTYLFSQVMGALGVVETVEVNGKQYQVDLRFTQRFKPYNIELKDVQKNDYIGTATPKDYSSFVVLSDTQRDVEIEKRVWMNNPMRYAGETFYQSGYHQTESGSEFTTLQVVKNTGWMAPYVGCMIVAAGMCAHFLTTLIRFLNRVSSGQTSEADTAVAEVADNPYASPKNKLQRTTPSEDRPLPPLSPPPQMSAWVSWGVPVVIVLMFALMLVSKSRQPKVAEGTMDLAAFGRQPVVYEGRVKPYDTLARNCLRVISTRESYSGRVDRKTLEENWDSTVSKVEKRWPDLTKGSTDFEPKAGDVQGLIDGIVAGTEANRFAAEAYVDKLTTKKYPAIRWLLDVISDKPEALNHKVFRIEALDVLQTFGLEQRSGFRYSYNELQPEMANFEKQLDRAAATERSELNNYQRRIMDLGTKLRLFDALRFSHSFPHDERGPFEKLMVIQRAERMLQGQVPFGAPTGLEKRPWEALSLPALRRSIPKLLEDYDAATEMQLAATMAEEAINDKEDEEKVKRYIREQEQNIIKEIKRGEDDTLTASELAEEAEKTRKELPPRMRDQLEILARNELQRIFQLSVLHGIDQARESGDGKKLHPVSDALENVLVAYHNENTSGFNQSVKEYEAALDKANPDQFVRAKTDVEAEYNRMELFYYCCIVYVFAGLLTFVAWLTWIFGWNVPIGRAAFGLAILAFLVHTYALVARIYISGRPPVTNLYSSAIFIGWACVLAGLTVDEVFRLGIRWRFISIGKSAALVGIGTLIAAISGFITLIIAQQGLAGDGDTLKVLQAVLDTTFWLSTHVVCITLGYAATFLAGIVATFYIALGVVTPFLNEKVGKWTLGKVLSNMTYGIICFAIFFSFVGTVLGGLWADDSWGRFWGWDPKENGALIIVLWNALVLHARWDGLVKDRGFAVLAIGGNIVTSWSWFGVNQLGIGLHSYGFTSGVLVALGIYVFTQLAIIGVGVIPKKHWWSFQDVDVEGEAA